MNSLVDSGTKGLVEILHGTELHRSPVTLGGHPFIGRDSQGSLSGGRCYRLRFFVNTVTYSEFLLVAVGSREKMLSVSTQKFFESFKVSEEPTR